MTMFLRLDRHATLAYGLVLRALSIALMAWFMLDWMPAFLAYSGGLPPLDARPTYGPDEALRLVTALGPSGRAFYLRMLATDFVLMGLVLVGDGILLGLLCRRLGISDAPRHLLVVGIAADVLENLVVGSVLFGAPHALFWVGGAATLVKQLAGLGILVCYIGGLALWAFRSARAPTTR